MNRDDRFLEILDRRGSEKPHLFLGDGMWQCVGRYAWARHVNRDLAYVAWSVEVCKAEVRAR